MDAEARWRRELIQALGFEPTFGAAKVPARAVQHDASIKPTPAESAHAVSNIRAWRSYLPESCVARMIEDGWQWST